MRISVQKNDPGHAEWKRLTKRGTITVTLNGEPIADVVTADEEQGFVVQMLRDAAGEFVRNKAGDAIETTSRGGVVVITVERGGE